jgi:hypothetical protein
MSNEELAAVYQSFTSAEADLLQTALQSEGSADARAAASDLFDLQALVLKEVSDRVAKGEPMPGADMLPPLSENLGPLTAGGTAPAERSEGRMTPGQARVLVETGAQSATARERMTGDFNRDMAARNISGLSARAVGDVLRSAPLTMNIDQDFLFGDSSILTDPDQRAQNIFDREERGDPTLDRGYMAVRRETEAVLFPELTTGAAAAERPTYAALNVNRSEYGAALTYGYGVIVFKPEVAQRATYTVDDSFYSLPFTVTPERRENFYNRLLHGAADRYPPAFLEEAGKADSPVRQTLDRLLDQLAGTPGANSGMVAELPEELLRALPERSLQEYLQADISGALGDRTKARARTATHDSLEALIPGMTTPAVASTALAALRVGTGESRPCLLGARYIEAQISGGIVPSRDIAEIRVDAEVFVDAQALAAARERAAAFEQRTGIPVIFEHRGSAPTPDDVGTQRFIQEHFHSGRVNAAAQDAVDNPLPLLRELRAETPALRALPEGTAELKGNSLSHALGKFQALVNEWREHPERTQPPHIEVHSEEELVKLAFNHVFKPVLELKGALLRELDSLPFENEAQKAAFAGWVMSAKALTSPEELRMIHACSVRQAAVLREMANAAPPPSPEALLAAFGTSMAQSQPALDAFCEEAGRNGEFGPDDKNTEISRIAFLSLALVRNVEGGGEALSRLEGLLNRPEQLQVSAQMESMSGEGEFAALRGYSTSNVTHLLLEMTRDSAAQLTGRKSPAPPRFIGELSLIPHSTREALRAFAPDLVERLDQTHPGYPPFAVPANPEYLPQSDAARRDFLTSHLDPYLNHEQTFELGRSTHGRGHIARAYIFATAMCNILEGQGVTVDRNAVLCGIAGHDMGRQGGGQDRWEERSAEMLTTAMRVDYGGDSMGEDYERAVGDCIAAHRSQTLEGLLLNAADSLDIGRTQSFDPERFAFLQGRAGEVPSDGAARMRNQLAREADLLQRFTDPYCMLRNVLQQITMEAMNDPGGRHTDQLMEQAVAIRQDIAGEYERRWSESGEQYMRGVEDVIRMNRDLFPMLGRYYADAAAAAA